jgi:hypothetical protein
MAADATQLAFDADIFEFISDLIDQKPNVVLVRSKLKVGLHSDASFSFSELISYLTYREASVFAIERV